MIKVLQKQKKVFIKYFIFMFMLLSILILFFTLFLEYKLSDVKRNEFLDKEKSIIMTENTLIANRINRISGDLLYVADCFRLNDNSDGNYSEVEKQWLAFSNRKKLYDQIRFIDLNGNEVIRINYYNSGAVSVDKSELQNKNDRYYFVDTIKLNEKQIYISKLDLNIENNEIEHPIKPMIRISTPYYLNGQLKGIIILNYLADDMLDQVKQVASTSNGNVFMLNTDGYWLYNSKNIDKEWSFMYKDKTNISFSNEFPTEWKILQNQNDGYHISDNGVFVYSNIITGRVFSKDYDTHSYVLGSGDWMLISYIPANSKIGIVFTNNFLTIFLFNLKNNYHLYVISLLISIIISSLLAINKNEKERIKYFSEYDVMTGVYNRRAGFERLSRIYEKSNNKSCLISICFIDINGLKDVNDALGHDAGDELIRSVVAGIKKNVRENDFIARMGGDEFLIIFNGLDENKSEEVWKRILKEYDDINKAESRKYLISVSHGIVSFQCNSGQYIDTIINQADQKMYIEKRLIKKELNVLRVIEE